MCVICINNKSRMTPTMVEDAFAANSDGGGIAWRENGKVHFRKGLELEEIKELVANVPLPFVSHFRIASIGGARPELCHPFPVSGKVPLMLKGTTTGAVVFHNGHWNDWKKELQEIVLHSHGRYQIPEGKWSDTRAIAFLVHVYGVGILDVIGEKTVAFGPDFAEIAGYGWTDVDGIACSNNFFKNRGHNSGYSQGQNYQGPMCKARKCTRRDLDNTGFCPDHSETHVDLSVGGGSTENPFDKALRLFSEGNPTAAYQMTVNKELSMKKFKRARKEWEDRLRKGKRLPQVEILH